MSETAPKDWQTSLLDRFLSNPNDSNDRQEYIRRGLIPTNNLSLYIVDDPPSVLVPGTDIKNHFDYRQQPFGPMIERLHHEYPELWEQAKLVAQERSDMMSQYWNALATGEGLAAATMKPNVEEAIWRQAEVYTEVITVLAPWLLEAGIDPLDVCK